MRSTVKNSGKYSTLRGALLVLVLGVGTRAAALSVDDLRGTWSGNGEASWAANRDTFLPALRSADLEAAYHTRMVEWIGDLRCTFGPGSAAIAVTPAEAMAQVGDVTAGRTAVTAVSQVGVSRTLRRQWASSGVDTAQMSQIDADGLLRTYTLKRLDANTLQVVKDKAGDTRMMVIFTKLAALPQSP